MINSMLLRPMSLYDTYKIQGSGWTLADELKFALFCEIISKNQQTVHKESKEINYNSVVYNVSNDIDINLTYNSNGTIGNTSPSSEGNSDNNNNNSNNNNGNRGNGLHLGHFKDHSSFPGNGVGNNVNTKA